MNFDRLAPFYRGIEWFFAGEKLQRCRTACLPFVVPAPRRVLLMGEGHGRSLVALAKAFPEAHFTCVDASAGMLDRAKDRLRRHGFGERAAEFVHADLHHWRPTAPEFDLVVTHFFLDCFPADQLAAVVGSLSAASASDARWLIADFCVPPKGFARWRARAILWSLYLFFRQAARISASHLTAPDVYLKQRGFIRQERRHSEWGLLHSDLWQREAFLPLETPAKLSCENGV